MSYRCGPCNRLFPDWNGLSQHVRTNVKHHLNTTFECVHCNRAAFRSKQSWKQHMEAVHPYCTTCDQTFESTSNLKQHLHSKAHQGDRIVCTHCDHSPAFPTRSAWMVHKESGICAEAGSDWHRINEMMRDLDDDYRNFTTEDYDYDYYPGTWDGERYACDYCDYTSGRWRTLEQHTVAHAPLCYICPSCKRRFVKLSALLMHIESEPMACQLMSFEDVQQLDGLIDIAAALSANAS